MDMRQSRTFGPNPDRPKPVRTARQTHGNLPPEGVGQRRETLEEVQRREQRETEANRWQGRLGRLHAEQATVAARDSSTMLYWNARVPTTEVPQLPVHLPRATLFRSDHRIDSKLDCRDLRLPTGLCSRKGRQGLKIAPLLISHPRNFL